MAVFCVVSTSSSSELELSMTTVEAVRAKTENGATCICIVYVHVRESLKTATEYTNFVSVSPLQCSSRRELSLSWI